MTNMPFEAWRKELSKIQTEIDELDEAFWDKYSNDEVEPEVFKEAEIEHLKERRLLVLKLQDHAKTPVEDSHGK
ncbi:hypothetical protein SEA_AFLAC_38 [Gordonia phage Aflac]|nr:hypothetical protein SEA_JODELIE19_40 [Gordonia phage Jodelie19]QWY82370.1 hypothetical protein SEA_AFLAC_38 [Gordonia phage Aflac]QXO13045.1 hypothetical protein SEA_FIGLIAR_38 [Gordonia phage Figliar]WNT45115.1 hypothetical protein SEA_OLGASCLOVER_39 [Gordonia phage OlgasClover]